MSKNTHSISCCRAPKDGNNREDLNELKLQEITLHFLNPSFLKSFAKKKKKKLI